MLRPIIFEILQIKAKDLLVTNLLIYLSRYLDQETAKSAKGPFRSSSQAVRLTTER